MPNRFPFRALPLLTLTAIAASASAADAPNDLIRREATEHSQALHTLHVLTDRYGPRLTGSPNHEAAAKWATEQLTSWGLKNAHLEAWDFGHPGWANERAEGTLLLPPLKVPLHFGVSAWTPSTKGEITASAVQIITPPGNRDDLSAFLDANRDKIRGKIVLIGKAAPPAPAQPAAGAGRRGGGSAAGAATTAPTTSRGPTARGTTPPPRAVPNADEMINAWLLANGALMRVDSGNSANGMLHETHNRTFEIDKAIPAVILRNEDFGRIERLLQSGEPVQLAFNIVNQTYPEGKTSHNVVAEIPGSGKPDEIVMLGAHLDCWHLATGATDNAAAATMMMEAVRIIQASGLKPLRTIRIGLWSGEEQGLFGSQAYVKEHFGTFENPKPDFAKVLCYFNVDSGAGSVRSVMVFGPPEAQNVLRDAIVPFADLGAGGASSFLSRALGSTDSSSFSHAGISTVDGMQNSSDYGLTHHTSFDTFDRVVPEDLIKGATVLAAAVFEVANRPEKLPLFTNENMPKPAQ